MKTIAQASKDSGINDSLVRAVIRQVGGMKEAEEKLKNVANYGADCGVPMFTYYRDTCEFFKKHRDSIVDLAEAVADQIGTDAVSMIKGFSCLNGDIKKSEISKTLYGRAKSIDRDAYDLISNSLAWFALEEVARAFYD